MGPEGFDPARELAGRLVEDGPAFTAHAPNITPAGPVGGWSDAELARAIREGLRPDGSLIGPPMPFAAYRGISDDDLAAIVAFLRTLPAVEHSEPASSYRIPLPPAWGPPVTQVTAPPQGVSAEYGGYIALSLAHCMECHSPMTETGPDYANALGQGGFVFHGPWGEVTAPNITGGPDGIGGYDDAALAAMITEGIRPDGSPMRPPMPYGFLAQMTPQDLQAVMLYLRGVPPLPGN
ncbi:cytochrome C [Mangrovicoccus sp. HB182678]|uniref:Cytochrome C n=1 Tax=Mangrovicoccus algicola TaxID=2771008 RepID=A0A8J6YVH7_9RHOB|nr:cytochrome C [Mangrovicoccus algicola]